MSIHPLTLEDMPAYAAVNILVNDATTTRALFSGPLSKDSIDRLFSKTHEAFKNPTTRFFKAVDDDTGEPIGFARWSVYDKPRKTESDQTEGVGYEEPAERLASLPEARNGGKTIREFFREMSTREKVLPDEKPRIGEWPITDTLNRHPFPFIRVCESAPAAQLHGEIRALTERVGSWDG